MNQTPDTDVLLETAITAAKLGGEILMRYLRDGVQMRNKSDNGGKSYDLVSDADLESEQAVAGHIRSQFPDHELLGEEELKGNPDAQHLWIIDPLDGTNNYAHKLPQFAVSIAYYHNGVPIVGVVFNPARDELYQAVRGGGAFLNGMAVRVDDATSLSNSLIGCGFYYDRGEMMRSTLSAIQSFFEQDIHGIRRFGAATLDLCMVGCGHLGGFFEYQLSPWDFAAGRLFVEEAGGKVTDAGGDALTIGLSSVVASNQHLHDAMISITAKHLP
ncbi:inositol monophosphatase family protein [Planctomycetes bacterium K23_9]|uniref:Inositol-1-monophosphatase n=1 Tax=Stieleria marina TaxID=1930275 RepID=A0A517P095_9BACT|nr:Inositol-1-monophosphatase [Planctomycetes bacterium K23_9]